MPIDLSPQKREALRRRYRPQRVRLLFVGEAPPASGRFFYNRDSGLYRALRDAFRLVDSAISDQNFLTVFRNSGCYLIDACARPVDHLDRKPRQAACLAGEALLSRRIESLQPQAIATLVRSIEANVDRAIARAGWHGPWLRLPYPGRWIHHRKVFQEALLPRLGKLVETIPAGNAPRADP